MCKSSRTRAVANLQQKSNWSTLLRKELRTKFKWCTKKRKLVQFRWGPNIKDVSNVCVCRVHVCTRNHFIFDKSRSSRKKNLFASFNEWFVSVSVSVVRIAFEIRPHLCNFNVRVCLRWMCLWFRIMAPKRLVRVCVILRLNDYFNSVVADWNNRVSV